MSDKKSAKKEDSRDVFEKALDEPYAHGGLIGGAVVGARILGGKFGKGRFFKGQPGINFGARSLGAGAGGGIGALAGAAADQKFKAGKYGKKGARK